MSKTDQIIKDARTVEVSLQEKGEKREAAIIHRLILSRQASRQTNSSLTKDIRIYRHLLGRAHDAMTRTDPHQMTNAEWDDIAAQIKAALDVVAPGIGLPDA